MAGTESRTLDRNRRNERILKREREDEGDEFADKEVFVTNSYKKTLEEFRELDEQDKRKEEAEGIVIPSPCHEPMNAPSVERNGWMHRLHFVRLWHRLLLSNGCVWDRLMS